TAPQSRIGVTRLGAAFATGLGRVVADTLTILVGCPIAVGVVPLRCAAVLRLRANLADALRPGAVAAALHAGRAIANIRAAGPLLLVDAGTPTVPKAVAVVVRPSHAARILGFG